MTINPDNIDPNFPVSGKDNDTQGFRDNFAQIKLNFQTAKAMFTDLHNKVIVKTALTDTTLDNDMNGAPILNPLINGLSTTAVTLGPSSLRTPAGAVVIDYVAGGHQRFILDNAATLSFTNFPLAPNSCQIRIDILVTGTQSQTIVLPAGVTVGISNIQGYNPVTKAISFTNPGTYSFQFTTFDGGTTISIEDLSRNMDPIYLPSLEVVTANANAPTGISLATTTTIITNSTGWAGVLNNGIPGQSKTIICGIDTTSPQILTVTQAGWGSATSGTITFNKKGQSATLRFVNNAWYCIGVGPINANTFPVFS